MLDLNACMRFSGVVDQDDAIVMQLCMEAAEEYHKNAGVPDAVKDSRLYVLSVYLLAGHFFDNRSQIGEGMSAAVPLGVVSCIQQLKGKPKAEGT